MPTITFFNLPPPKREKLLRAAVAEFARKPCGEVSINRIIQAAEIPRGSFYQYFADKSDLFRHVLRCYDRQLEEAFRLGLERCGGKPLDLPLALYDLVLSYIQERRDEFSLFLGILRQNVGMDAGQLLSLSDMMALVLTAADWSGLALDGVDERMALLDLLISAAGQALMAACCGKLEPRESRRRLALKIALIRRGLEPEEPSK
ncbi:MAG: TetR/AcrR family transcriptional regulator [Oscillospiraceae bacterium]|jgi:AcrR family transcriptional regulator|nr:TetR/AcrR family transcriptional regulator [Oscillospiraceae bacterium]